VWRLCRLLTVDEEALFKEGMQALEKIV